MFKRVLIIAGFVVFFVLMVAVIFHLQQNSQGNATTMANEMAISNSAITTDSVHAYYAEDISAECSSDDHIFCAVEKVVKCTMTPELNGCTKDNVPAFVIGKAQDTPRPTEISFKIVKIKPVPGSNDISVYTESDCNAGWFGLCKGTVVYSLTPRDGENRWRVTSIYALEPVEAETPTAEAAVESAAAASEPAADENVAEKVETAEPAEAEAAETSVEATESAAE